MATILSINDFSDPEIKNRIEADGIYLVKCDTYFRELYMSKGLSEEDIPKDEDENFIVDDVVKETLVLYGNILVCVDLLSDSPAPLGTNIEYWKDKWSSKIKNFRDMLAAKLDNINKNIFTGGAPVENQKGRYRTPRNSRR